jgi:uncharacterized protein YbjT (DUF2867 family)
MKIVIFGNGLIGSQVLTRLQEAGHDAVALGREAGIDTTTGKGVPEAIAGADVVVDLTNSPSWADDDVLAFFRESTSHLLAAEKEAGVAHHVILTIVGADRLTDAGYMRAKLAQEELVQAGPIPYSIVRSTQFFEFVSGIAESGADGDLVRATPGHLQPIASRDVAANVADIAAGPPLNGTIEIAGPDAAGIDALVRELFASTGDSRDVVTDPKAGYFGALLNETALVPTPGVAVRIAGTHFSEWLAEQK